MAYELEMEEGKFPYQPQNDFHHKQVFLLLFNFA